MVPTSTALLASIPPQMAVVCGDLQVATLLGRCVRVKYCAKSYVGRTFESQIVPILEVIL